jgi:hypothetical protein
MNDADQTPLTPREWSIYDSGKAKAENDDRGRFLLIGLLSGAVLTLAAMAAARWV